jgi:poly(3-hydroxybutyrate) depolymerase
MAAAMVAAAVILAMAMFGSAVPVAAGDAGGGPSAAASCRPLVLNLHGGMAGPSIQRWTSGLTEADAELEVVVPARSGLVVWGEGDVAGLASIVDEYRQRCDAPVTATGMSSGGAMAQHLLDLGIVERAVPVAGLGCDCGLSSWYWWIIANGRPVDGYPGAGAPGVLVAVHGTADNIDGASAAFADWADRNGSAVRTELITHDGGHEWPAFATDVVRTVALAS